MEEFLPFIIIGGIVILVVGGHRVLDVRGQKTPRRHAGSRRIDGTDFLSLTGILRCKAGFRISSCSIRVAARKMSNLIQGDSGEVKIAIFDYQYTTGSGKNSNTHHQSIVALQSADLVCPDFSMRPEGMFDKIGSALGFQDIDFESHPKFSSLFVLQSSSEKAIREYFTPALLEFFEARPGISVEAQNGTLFFYRTRQRVKPHQIKDNLAEAYEVFGVMTDRS